MFQRRDASSIGKVGASTLFLLKVIGLHLRIIFMEKHIYIPHMLMPIRTNIHTHIHMHTHMHAHIEQLKMRREGKDMS